MAEGDRLGGLEMGEARHHASRHARRRARRARAGRRRARRRPRRSRRGPRGGNRSRPGRCASARCGAGRRPAPISSASRASTCMWMSSSAGSSCTPIRAYSSSIRSSPSAMAEASASGTMPWVSSIATWASEAAMSSRHSLLSKPIEALISRISAAGPPAKRPPHIRLDLGLSSAMAGLLERGR